MNESSKESQEDQKAYEATHALQDIAADVEKERAERGHSDVDSADEPDGRAMSDEAALSDENPDGAGDTREDRPPGAVGGDGHIASALEGVLDAAPNRALYPH